MTVTKEVNAITGILQDIDDSKVADLKGHMEVTELTGWMEVMEEKLRDIEKCLDDDSDDDGHNGEEDEHNERMVPVVPLDLLS